MRRAATFRQASFRQTRATHLAVLLATTALGTSLVVAPAQAQNLPTGGSVAAGNVSMAAPTPTQLNITQTSQSAVVNWQSFSVGQGYGVNIQQPNSTSALLNRVTGNAPSTIAGSLTANGQVYLVNPNGIAITRSGVVNTGGFVASTLGISDSDFMSGKRTFTGNGASAGVSNAGTITIGQGGFAALLGGTVENAGNIEVPLGRIGLGSGERVTLDFAGDGFLQVAVPTKSGGNDALIRNSGVIRADGGSVIISAATAREAARNAVNISGVVQARTIGGRSGSIVIGGGVGGAVKITGQVAATSAETTGGSVTVTGQHIALDGALIDVTGRTGGGTIRIGGGRQGQGPLQHADTVHVDATTIIRADATTAGNGGDVVLWSDQLTMFAGTITARGGFQTGNGGQAEVSGKAMLGYTGFTDLTAANGKFGTLLLDPFNVTISNGTTNTNNTGGIFAPTSNDSIINAATLMTALGGANVTITTGSGGAQAGNITVAAPLTWSTATTLELIAAGGIAINAPISITGAGGLALTATAQAGITTTGLTFGNGASVDYGATDKGGSFSLNGTNYTLVYSMAQLDAIDGVYAVDGSALEVYGTGLAGNYALATNLVATDITYTQALVATNSSDRADTQFAGRLDGLGHTVTGLTIDAPDLGWVGLLGFVSGANASVSNIGLVGGNVSGRSDSGSLVGWLDKGVVQNSFSSVSVTSTELIAGGLVGFNAGGTIQSSHASGTVSSPYVVGGLVGWNDNFGFVTNSYATGAVTGDNEVGGLMGYNYGLVSNSYATGAVTSSNYDAGGLIGYNAGTVQLSHASGTIISGAGAGGLIGGSEASSVVSDSYATGVVTSTESLAGGLMGYNGGSVSNSYATGTVAAVGAAGGLIGSNDGGDVTLSYATGAVTAADAAGGLIGANGGAVSQTYATGTVTTTSTGAGGLIGINNGNVSNSHATGAVSGVQGTGGLVGNNTEVVQNSYATGSVTGTTNNTGGLIGRNEGLVDASYATGTVRGYNRNGGLVGYNWRGTVQNSYATGMVFGLTSTGGLVGQNSQSSIVRNTYATGAVTAAVTDADTDQGTGGLIGSNATLSRVEMSYATGRVVGQNDVAGLIGHNTGATVSASYWNSETSGQATGIGFDNNNQQVNVIGLTTAQLQGVLPAGFSATRWSTGAGLYAYLNWQFAAGTTPQSISGIAYKADGTVLTGATVAGTLDGKAFAGTTGTGANGYYYFLLPQGSAQQGSGVFVDIAGNAVKSNAYVRGASGPVQNLDLRADLLTVRTDATTLSGLASGLKRAADSTPTTDLVFTPGGALTPNTGTSVWLTAAGAFDIDQNLIVPNAVLLNAAGNLTIAATGSVSSSTGDATLVTGSRFLNNSGADAVSAANGRWLVYSADPRNDTPGGLVYGFKQYGAAYGVTAVAQATGNGVLYSVVPTASLSGTVAKTYDGNTSVVPGSFSIAGLGIGGEVLGITYTGLTYDNANAATGKTVTANGFAVASAMDGSANVYGYATTSTTASGAIGTVTARAITVTADAQTRVYGDANPALTYAIGGMGLVTGENLSGGLTTGAAATSGVGNYGITQGSLAASSNYALSYVGADLSVTARPITVTANGQSRVYGDANPTLTYGIGGRGLANSDTLSGSLTTGATTITGVGSYGIAQGSLAASSNYALTYVGADLAITARPITVTANGQSRVYGDANPTLTYGIGGRGLVNNDSLSGGLTTGATTTSGVGVYGIAQGSLAASSNYALSYVGADLAITARPITVTADGQSRVYGDANPTLTYGIGGRGLVNGDSLSGGLSTGATTTTGVGSYGIAQGGLAASSNYALTYVGANLSVAARPIAVVADAQSRTVGAANPTLTYSVGARGLVNGDTLAGSLATVATPASAAGTYAITQGTLVNALNPNYAITYTGADLAVVAAALPPATPEAQTTSPFIVAPPNAPQPNASTISFQVDQSGTGSITPLTATPGRVANAPSPASPPTQTAANQNADDDIVTGSIGPQAIKSADGFIYPPLSQYDAAQYTGNKLPGYEGQAGEATIAAMLLRGTQRSSDTPKIDQLFEPGKGLQWKGVNWENPVAEKVGFSDGADRAGAPGESFPIQAGTTDLAALLGKGVLILTASAKEPTTASFSLLGIAISAQGVVANDPSTGQQVLLGYDAQTKTLGAVTSVRDAKTGTWTRLADVKPADGGLSQAQLDQFAQLSVDRFAAVDIRTSGAR
jgi:filamentous hemagglutinin family protein